MKEVYYFTADWCGPCKKVKPIVEEINNNSTNKFKIINVDLENNLAKEFEIKSIPTFILIENNKEIKRIIGAQTREQLEALINYEENA